MKKRQVQHYFFPGDKVIPRKQNVLTVNRIPGLQVRACRETIGLRLPAHLVPRMVSQLTGGGLASTSANVSGDTSPATAQEALAQLDGLVDLVLDGGPASVARESTVVSFAVDPPEVLREGALPVARLREVLGEVRTK